MVLVSEVVCISRGHTLQIDDVAPLVGASDSFDFDATGDFSGFSLCIQYLVDLDTQLRRDFLHELVELWMRLNCLLLVDRAVLSQA